MSASNAAPAGGVDPRGNLSGGNTSRGVFRAALGLTLFFYVSGVVFTSAGVLPDRFRWVASVVMFLTALTAFLSELKVLDARTAGLRLVVLGGGLFAVELLGVRTGYPFGAYSYTSALGLAVGGVPLALAAAWYSAVTISSNLSILALGGRHAGRWVHALLAGGFTLSLDLVLEPTAAYVEGWWRWAGGEVPPQNYAAWFGISTLAAAAVWERGEAERKSGRKGLLAVSLLLFGGQFFLFAVTGVVHGHVIPVLAGTALAAAPLAAGRLIGRSPKWRAAP
ncbi:MAG: carotenoid biosynthesis protein [Bacteroidota bacterium]